MAGINNSNFYIDVTSMTDLKNKYDETIKSLTELYFNFETEINNIESEKLWEGKSFDKFKENFDEWKLEYLEQLAKMIQLKDFTQSVIDVAEDLIEVRGNLKNSLEV